jgi:hypothetical protein
VPFDFFKGFLLFLSIPSLVVSPLCGFIEGFGQEGVVRDPDPTETCGSPKFSDLLAGLRGQDGTYSLFPLRAELVLPLGQMKAEAFDSILANLGHFPRDFVSCIP